MLFIPIYAEWFLDAGQEIHETFSNQSYAIGIAYKTPKNWTFELYFVRQNSWATFDGEFDTADHLYQFKIRRHLFKKESREN